MTFPETLAEQDVAKILEKEGFADEPIPVPVYQPEAVFHEEVGKWRRLMYPTLSVGTVVGINALIYSQAPGFYRLENIFNIGTVSMLWAIGGVLLAETLSCYFADKKW